MPKAAHMLLLADLHVGSALALWPRGHSNRDGTHQLASYQDWLLDRFNETIDQTPKLDAVIIDGDLLDGENKKGSGRGCITSDPFLQAQAAVALLQPLRKKAKRLFLVRGTPYHEGESCEALEWVGSELKAERWGDRNRYTDLVLERSWQGHVLNVTHHMTSGMIYTLGGANRTAMFAAIAEADKGRVRADVIVRAHTHSDGMGFVNGRWVIFLPCWSFVTPYAVKRMEYYRATASNSLGAVLLSSDGDGNLGVKPIRYVTPKQEVEAL